LDPDVIPRLRETAFLGPADLRPCGEPSAVSVVALPFFMIGELSMIVWLLVKGARET
jgi:hypothetical protein